MVTFSVVLQTNHLLPELVGHSSFPKCLSILEAKPWPVLTKFNLFSETAVLGHGPKSLGCQVVANLVGQLSFDKIGKIMCY